MCSGSGPAARAELFPFRRKRTDELVPCHGVLPPTPRPPPVGLACIGQDFVVAMGGSVTDNEPFDARDVLLLLLRVLRHLGKVRLGCSRLHPGSSELTFNTRL